MDSGLSSRDKALVVATWTTDFQTMYEIGTEIYAQIFHDAPETRALFPFVGGEDDESWHESRVFRTQALKFVQVLSQTVQHLDDGKAEFHAQLMDIGQRHQRFAARGFKPEYWDFFESAVKEVMSRHMEKAQVLGPSEREEAVRAWRLLAKYIIATMKIGFQRK